MCTLTFPGPDTPLNPDTDAHRDLLSRIQGNILKGHGRHHGHTLFFRLVEQEPTPRPGEFWKQIATLATSALQQHQQARENRKLKDGGSRFVSSSIHRNVAFTAAGMKALDVGDTKAANVKPGAPPPPALSGRTLDENLARAFNAGMRASFRGTQNTQIKAEFEGWEPEYLGPDFHGLWFLACSHRRTLRKEVRKMRAWCKRWGLTVAAEQATTTWRDQGKPREAFGFVDGISMPEFFAKCGQNGSLPVPPAAQGPVAIPLSQVLISKEISPLHVGGSYLVVRKLEQNVRAFRAHEEAMKEQLTDAKLGHSMAGPLLMGRNRDGMPLVPLKTPGGDDLNAFDFDADDKAERCPFHAHIRKMNPRVDPADPKGEAQRRVQLVRRGMLYDPNGRLLAARRRTEGWPDKEVGLFFMACMSDIGGQFEVMQLHWVSDLNFPVAGTGGQDPILAQEGQKWQWGQLKHDIGRFVTPRGGEYFYLPSFDWLKSHVS